MLGPVMVLHLIFRLLHFAAAIGLFAAVLVEVVTVHYAQRAQTPARLRWATEALPIRRALEWPALIFILTSGLGMVLGGWGWRWPWIDASLVAVAFLAWSSVVVGRALGRIVTLADQGTLEPDAAVTAGGRGLHLLVQLRAGVFFGSILLMMMRPGLTGTVVILGGTIAGWMLVASRRAQGGQHTHPPAPTAEPVPARH